MPVSLKLDETAKQLVKLLKKHKQKIVLAESCTGGLVSATLCGVPGVSEYHCGSSVVYRLETKAEWLDVSRDKLIDPGPVSPLIAEQMAAGVLLKTPEATLSLSITGHLGPNSPKNQDGLIYIGVAERVSGYLKVRSEPFQLSQQSKRKSLTLRDYRQQESVGYVLEEAIKTLKG